MFFCMFSFSVGNRKSANNSLFFFCFVLSLLLFSVFFFKENLEKECNDIRNKKKNCL